MILRVVSDFSEVSEEDPVSSSPRTVPALLRNEKRGLMAGEICTDVAVSFT